MSRVFKELQRTHDGLKYNCDFCEYQNTYKGEMKKHKQMIHENVKFKCDECDYKLEDKQSKGS